MNKVFGLILLAYSITSCTPARHPAIAIPKKWTIYNSHYINSNKYLPCFAWWKQFHDAELNQLIDKSLLYNNDIKIAIANIKAAQGELKRVQLNWIPNLTANGGYSSFPDLGFPGVIMNVVGGYVINIFKQIAEQKKAKYELKVTKAMHEGIRLAIIRQITSNYFLYLAQKEQLTLFHYLEKNLTKLINFTRQMYQGGLFTKIDVEEAKIKLALIKAKEKLVRQNIIISQNALHYLLNKNPGKFKFTNQFKNLNHEQMIIGALPFNIIENRPDMKQATEELIVANANLGISFSNLLPSINIAMARGEIGTEPNGWQLGQAIHFNQALLEIPLLRLSTFGELAKMQNLKKATYYRYTNTLRKVLNEVSNDLSAHDLYTKRLHSILKARQDLTNTYRLNKTLYQQGIISYLSLIESQIKVDTITIEANQYKLEQLITIITLYHDLAAGYNYKPARSGYLR